MINQQVKFLWCCFWLCISYTSFSQSQSCPININYSSGNLTHWFAYTGNNQAGNGSSAIKQTYDSTVASPVGTIGAVNIPEYNLASVNGIQVKTTAGIDPFGGFTTIPTINGYAYGYSIILGSTSITRSAQGQDPPGGYIRGVSYTINVPATPATQPYTMTYAYAMVLENGRHNSNNQPLFSAMLKIIAKDSIITCASPSYLLPTNNNASNGGGATLDSAAAIASGFRVSPKPSPNSDPNATSPNAPHLQDVWTKGWTEVTFDLSPYRGQQVSLTFEADNCVPGGHFAYAYVALRNTCAGLLISGDTLACTNAALTYSIPALAGANYQWTIPPSWTLTSDASSNIITVTAGATGGSIIAKEQNSCANLSDTLQVATTPPTVPGNLSGDATVCTGNNSSVLLLSGNNGNVVKWIASTDNGATYTDVPDATPTYNAQNLTTTTLYKALVQNTTACEVDTSTAAIVTVDAKSVGGFVNPDHTAYCNGQDQGGTLSLTGNTGGVVDWQSSLDNLNWSNVVPTDADSNYNIGVINASTYYRVIVQNGVCIPDTSSVAIVSYSSTPYPRAFTEPADTTICYGSSAQLNALITIGTNYSWTNTSTLINQGSGTIGSNPFAIHAKATPTSTSDYVLSILNNGCPNALLDTFHVIVVPPVIVNAGNDTSVVIGEPLQFNATSNEGTSDAFLWTPTTYLSNPAIPNPIGTYGIGIDSIRYIVRATDSVGCYGEDAILVKIFKTAPDIFVPNAFTPGGATNTVFRPIAVGISSLRFFRIYNRWGQLVYETSRLGDGWNGTFNGKPQDTGSFVWMVQGTTYSNKTIFHKGTMTLIR